MTCHRTLAVQDCLDSEGIQRLVWPARSPDLNPIENVWDALGRQVAGRNYPPTNKNILIRALTEEWDKLPQQLLDNVVQSMVRRVECCITLHGGHIPAISSSIRVAGGKREDTRYPQSVLFQIVIHDVSSVGRVLLSIKTKVGPTAAAHNLTIDSRTSSRYRIAVTEPRLKM
ncbi:hypothetical protein TNCV_4495091 [Trichonephila clavipes]|nr:hypothetical protein TNCV_4495091 [Trichonephila clavipes]